MKGLTVITVIACAGLSLTACKKDPKPTPSTTVSPNGAQLTAFFSSNVTNATQHFTVDAVSGGSIYGNHGTRVYIAGSILYNGSNQLVTGNVDVALVEIFDRASMILLDKPTMGRLPNGDLSTLISGGEYYLKITQNGQELHTNGSGVWVSIPAGNTGGAQAGMTLFDGLIADDGHLEWQAAADTTVAVDQDSTGMSYNILDGSWGWTNVDRFYSDPRPKTVLKVKLPDGFDNTNSEVYLTYDGEPTALASLDIFTTDGFFSEHYGLIPIGLEVHLIAVTMIDGQLNYSIQGVTIADGQIEYVNSFTPITQSALADLINALP